MIHEGKRMKDLAHSKRLAVATLARELNVSRTMTYNYFNMESLPHEVKEIFCKLTGVNENEFNAPVNKNDVKTPVNLSKDFENTDKYHNVVSPLLGNTPGNNLIIVPLKAFGGFLTGYSNKVYMDNLKKIYFPWIQGECYAFEVEGYSMFLTHKLNGKILKEGYEPGSYVVTTAIEDFTWLRKDKDYVFVTIDGIIIKKFVKIEDGKMHLESINKEFPAKPIPLKSVKKVFYIEDTAKNKPQ